MSLTAAELVAQLVPATAREPIAKAREILSRIADLGGAVDRVSADANEARKALPAARNRLAAIEADIDVGQHLEADGIDPRVDLKALLADRTRLAGEILALEGRCDRGARIHDGVGFRRDGLLDELQSLAPEIHTVFREVESNVTWYAAQLLISALNGEAVTLPTAGTFAAMANATLRVPDDFWMRQFRLPDPTSTITASYGAAEAQLGPQGAWVLKAEKGKIVIGDQVLDWRDDATFAAIGKELIGIRAVRDAVVRALRYTPLHGDHVAAAAEKAARAAEAVAPGAFVPASDGYPNLSPTPPAGD